MGKAGKLWKAIGAAGAGVAALAAVNARIRRQAQEPDDAAFGGEARTYEWRHGGLFYKVAGAEHQGAPVVFVHGVGAGASSFMWRRNFDELAQDFRVLAPDLLGFGFSDKPATAPYSADLYVELITDFLREVAGPGAHLVASSLGAAYCVHVAYERPELVRSLVLVAPTGAGGSLRARPGVAGAAFYGLLQSPVLGTSFYNVIASERSIRDYARRELFYDRSFGQGFLANAQVAIIAISINKLSMLVHFVRLIDQLPDSGRKIDHVFDFCAGIAVLLRDSNVARSGRSESRQNEKSDKG